jgi:hypothetical protein
VSPCTGSTTCGSVAVRDPRSELAVVPGMLDRACCGRPRFCSTSGGSRVPAKPDTSGVDDERPPICPTCGVTMVAAELSALGARDRDWVCLECEETGEPEEA